MRLIDLTGQRFGRLEVIKQGRRHRSPSGTARVLWTCRCDCGTVVDVWRTALRSGQTVSCGCFHSERLRENPRRDVVTYDSAHSRVVALRGRASDHACIDCGEAAKDWCYDGLDPDALRGGRSNCLYSLDPNHYQPRCRFCHRAYDAQIDLRTPSRVRATETEGATA